MHLSNSLVEEFRRLHQLKYGKNIKYVDAEYQLKELAELVRLIVPAQKELRHE